MHSTTKRSRGKEGERGGEREQGGQIGAGKAATSSAKLQSSNTVPVVSEINHGHWIHPLALLEWNFGI